MQSVLDNVNIHKGALERLEAAVSAVVPLLDEADQEEVRGQLEDVTTQYRGHLFDSEGYLVERWIETKEAGLSGLHLTAVQTAPLQVSAASYARM